MICPISMEVAKNLKYPKHIIKQNKRHFAYFMG